MISPDITASGTRLTIDTTKSAPTRLDDPRLEALRLGIPAARSLPLLALLACAFMMRLRSQVRPETMYTRPRYVAPPGSLL